MTSSSTKSSTPKGTTHAMIGSTSNSATHSTNAGTYKLRILLGKGDRLICHIGYALGIDGFLEHKGSLLLLGWSHNTRYVKWEFGYLG